MLTARMQHVGFAVNPCLRVLRNTCDAVSSDDLMHVAKRFTSDARKSYDHLQAMHHFFDLADAAQWGDICCILKSK
jgi:hypothetical protein